MSSVIPEGWSVECGDPSVGIFGETWTHEDCTAVQGPGNGDLLGVDHFERKLGRPDDKGMAAFRHTLLCEDCGALAFFDVLESVGLEEAVLYGQ